MIWTEKKGVLQRQTEGQDLEEEKDELEEEEEKEDELEKEDEPVA